MLLRGDYAELCHYCFLSALPFPCPDLMKLFLFSRSERGAAPPQYSGAADPAFCSRANAPQMPGEGLPRQPPGALPGGDRPFPSCPGNGSS